MLVKISRKEESQHEMAKATKHPSNVMMSLILQRGGCLGMMRCLLSRGRSRGTQEECCELYISPLWIW